MTRATSATTNGTAIGWATAAVRADEIIFDARSDVRNLDGRAWLVIVEPLGLSDIHGLRLRRHFLETLPVCTRLRLRHSSPRQLWRLRGNRRRTDRRDPSVHVRMRILSRRFQRWKWLRPISSPASFKYAGIRSLLCRRRRRASIGQANYSVRTGRITRLNALSALSSAPARSW